MSKIDAAVPHHRLDWRGFVAVMSLFGVGIVLTNLLICGISIVAGPPTYLHSGRCIAGDRITRPARYDDLFHRWEVRSGNGFLGPSYVVASEMRCVRTGATGRLAGIRLG